MSHIARFGMGDADPSDYSGKRLVELLERGRISRDTQLRGLNSAVICDFVLVRESDVDRTARSASAALQMPTMYSLTGSGADKLFIGDVIGSGPDDGFGAGATVLLNEQNISYRITERGDKRYLLRSIMIAATLDRETFEVKPVHDQILVKFDAEDEKRAVAHQSGGPIWLPTSDSDSDDVARARPGTRGLVVNYGAVVDVGPGCNREGAWSAPPCVKGDLVMYDASYGTLPITIKGKAYTLVPSRNIAHIADRTAQ